jgi:hypothetical protein
VFFPSCCFPAPPVPAPVALAFAVVADTRHAPITPSDHAPASHFPITPTAHAAHACALVMLRCFDNSFRPSRHPQDPIAQTSRSRAHTHTQTYTPAHTASDHSECFATSLGPLVGFCLSVNPPLRVVYFSHARTGHIVLSDRPRLLLVSLLCFAVCFQLESELNDFT